jgi:hypothetical protein
MTVDVRVEGDDDRMPSQATDDYWVYARRHKGRYPRATVRSGKWLLFIAKEEIDDAWAAIKRATEEGRLGECAKVATARPNSLAISPQKKVMCVYTYDGDDRADGTQPRARPRTARLASRRTVGDRGFWPVRPRCPGQ